MTEHTELILIANAKFYQVLSLADAAGMRSIWLRSEAATCIHPGWHKIVGYKNIQQIWAAVFTNQGPIHIWPSDEEVKLEAEVAWVTCIENIDASASAAHKIVCVRARNAFRETRGGWKMLYHRAEATPGRERSPSKLRWGIN